jgi:hypothetical protein
MTRAACLLGVLVFAGACGSGDEGQPGSGTGTGTGAGTSSAPLDAGAPGDGGGKLKVAEQGCKDDSECETNHCFSGNAQSFCTVSCTTANAATVCVAPLTGSCNKQGLCKRD